MDDRSAAVIHHCIHQDPQPQQQVHETSTNKVQSSAWPSWLCSSQPQAGLADERIELECSTQRLPTRRVSALGATAPRLRNKRLGYMRRGDVCHNRYVWLHADRTQTLY
jgi:hypothetical protein